MSEESTTDLSELPADAVFNKVHPLTPLLRFWTLILAIFAGLAFNINLSSWTAIWGFVSGEHDVAIWPFLLSIGGFVLACALIWLVSRIWWKATGFRLTDEEIQMKRGVLNTQLRTARYDRVQAVDLVESLIARIFRVAAVRVETAGGNDSVIEIAFLKRAQAEALRKELVQATQGDRATPAQAASPEAPVLPEQAVSEGGAGVDKLPGSVVVPEIPITRTLLSAVLSLSTIILVLGAIVFLLTPIGIAVALPFLAGLGPTVWNLIDKSWKFTAVLNGDVLNVSYGLADRRKQSIPLSRIHGVGVSQPLLWRKLGWWTVSVTVAGYGPGAKQGGTTRILPVGSKDLALKLLELVGPLDAREVEELANPARVTRPHYRSPEIAKWVSPLDRTRQGVTLVGERPRAAIVHSGRLIRRMSVIELEHIQELTLERGPIQRQLGLSTVRFDLVPGPVKMEGEDLAYADGMELLNVLRQRRLPELNPVRPGQ